MINFSNELKQELVNHILPFWMKLIDTEFGGYFGRVDHNLKIINDAPKSAIITSRILWSFSAAFNFLREDRYRAYADHAYQFMVNKLFDKKFGGLYLLTDYKGYPIDKRKHINNLSYAIYALSEYYKINRNSEVRDLAVGFFDLIESKKNIEGYYLEEFDEKWDKKTNEFLDRYDLHAEFTLNTYIHLLESYSSLYSIWPSERLVAEIKNLLTLFEKKMFSQEWSSFYEFFDSNWQSLIDIKMFGHDIELSWLLSRTLDILNIQNRNILHIIFLVCKNIHEKALIHDSVILEDVKGTKNTVRMWWVQTEAMIGFYNAYQIFKDERFLEDVYKIWKFTKVNLIDKRKDGDWFSSITENLDHLKDADIADAWKGPYHTTRMCIELTQRLNTVTGKNGEILNV